MEDVAVFFAEGACAAEGREGEVEDVGDSFGLEGVFVEYSGSWGWLADGSVGGGGNYGGGMEP